MPKNDLALSLAAFPVRSAQDPVTDLLDQLVEKLIHASGVAALAFRTHKGVEKEPKRTVEELLKILRDEIVDQIDPMLVVAAYEARRTGKRRKALKG